MLSRPIGQATGTDADDASANFTNSIKEEAAHGVATQHVSQGSTALGTGVAELGTAPLPSETSLSPSVFVPLEQTPGP